MRENSIREFEDCSDAELVNMAQSGNLDAEEALIRKYKETVKIKANMYFMAGADEDDVVQEGMIGLFKAIRQYDFNRDVAFRDFCRSMYNEADNKRYKNG